MKRGKKIIRKKIIKKKSNSKVKKDISKKTSFNRKTLLIVTVIFIALILLFLIIKNFPLTSKVIERPPAVSNCSNESIKAAWEAIFKGSSENITIVAPNETILNQMDSDVENLEFGKDIFMLGGCPAYYAYQINGSSLKYISGWKKFLFMDTILIAYNGNFKSEFISNLTNFSFGNQTISFSFDLENFEPLAYPRTTNISSIEEAKSHFESIFNMTSTNWTKEDYYYYNTSAYVFEEYENISNVTLFGESLDPNGIKIKSGYVAANESYEYYAYSEISINGILESLAERYQNWTSPINTSLQNITIYVNSSKLEILKDYNQTQKLVIQQNNQTIVETELNFTDDFDFTKIVLKKQDTNSSRGYIIINGLHYAKNITLDRIDSDSESVCVKDQEIDNINEISDECDSTNEYILDCPGQMGNFTCKISGNKFIVTGLMHSAITEIIPPEEPCIQEWSCNDWSNIDKECGYRNCIDLNGCGNVSGMPLEEKTCPVCVPDWNCTEFIPKKCPKEEKRIRTCTDLNDCGTLQERPDLMETCERSINWIWILIGIIGGIFLLIIILLIAKSNRRSYQDSKNYPNNPRYPPNNQQPPNDQHHNSILGLEEGYNQEQIFVPRTKPKFLPENISNNNL